MKLAIPNFRNRVSPVFDWAGRVVFVDIRRRREVGRDASDLVGAALVERADRLVERQVDLVACGAISFVMRALLELRGIPVVGWIAGDFDEVLRVFREWRGVSALAYLPGCERLSPAARRAARWGGVARRGRGDAAVCLCPLCGYALPASPGAECPRCGASRLVAL